MVRAACASSTRLIYPQLRLRVAFGGMRSLEGQIVVGTLETIASQLGASGFGHACFDLVVTDECHRSIYSTHRATLGRHERRASRL